MWNRGVQTGLNRFLLGWALLGLCLAGTGCPSRTVGVPSGAIAPSTEKTQGRREPVPAGAAPSKGADPSGAAFEAFPLDVTVPDPIAYDRGFAQLTYWQARVHAERVGKPIFMYVQTPWCGPCRELDKEVFATPGFQAYARSIVSIDVDASTPEGKPVAERFGIQSYPTMVVMAPDGTEIERFFGFHPAFDFVRTIQDYAAGRNTASDLKRQALEAPDNLELAFAAGQALAIRKRGQEALPFLDTVVSRQAFHSTGQMPLALLLLGETVLAEQLQDYPRSEEVLTRLAKEHPSTFHGREALYTIAQNLLAQGRSREASAFLLEKVSLSMDQPLDVYHFATFSLRFRVLLDESIRYAREASEKNPSALYLRKVLADLYVRKGDIPGAIAVLEETVRLNPSDQAARKMLDTLNSARQRTGE